MTGKFAIDRQKHANTSMLDRKTHRQDRRGLPEGEPPSRVVQIAFEADEMAGKTEFPSDETVTIWMSVIDASDVLPEGIADESLDITITRPDFTEESYQETTNDMGWATLEYDLSEDGRGEGEYMVQVEDEEDTPMIQTFDVGPQFDFSTLYTPQDTLVGEEITVGVVARDPTDPISDLDVDFEVQRDGTQIAFEETETGEDGFATVTFEADEDGFYTIDVDPGGGFEPLSASIVTHEDVVDSGPDVSTTPLTTLDDGVITYSGYFRDQEGHLADEELEFVFYYEPDAGAPIELNEVEVTTDDGGFFSTTVEIDEDELEEDDQTVEVAGGVKEGGGQLREVEVVHDQVIVRTEPFDMPVSISLATTDGDGLEDTVHAPGETVEVEVTATANGDPIDGEEVDIVALARDRGTLGGFMISDDETVELADGTATFEVELPEDLIDGAFLEVVAALEYEGETYEWGELNVTRIQRYDIEFARPQMAGEVETVELEATDPATGDAVEGVQELFDLGYADGFRRSYAQGALQTDDGGEASMDVEVPENHWYRGSNYESGRYHSGNVWFNLDRQGSLEIEDDLVPGSEISFSLDADSSGDLYGFIQIRLPEGHYTTDAALEPDGSATVQLPSFVQEDERTMVTVVAIDDAGNQFGDVVLDKTGESEFDISAETSVEDDRLHVTLSGTNVDDISVTDLWRDWELDDYDESGADTFEDALDDEGRCTFSWDGGIASTSPSLEIDPYERHTGGTYKITVSASAPDDDHEETFTETFEL